MQTDGCWAARLRPRRAAARALRPFYDCYGRPGELSRGKTTLAFLLVSYTPLAHLELRETKELAKAGSRSAQTLGGATFVPLNKR